MKRFVTFEGIDGSGKSTVTKRVFNQLKSKGYDVVLTFEPTDTWIGKSVQKCIETKTNPFVTAFAFIAGVASSQSNKINRLVSTASASLLTEKSTSSWSLSAGSLTQASIVPVVSEAKVVTNPSTDT